MNAKSNERPAACPPPQLAQEGQKQIFNLKQDTPWAKP